MPSPAPEVSVSTVSATATATSTGHHMLKIEGYKHLKGMHRNGEFFESCRFKAAGHNWRIVCYPNGSSKEDAGYMSLFLRRDDDDDESAAAAAAAAVYAEFRLALVYPRTRLVRWPPHAARGKCTYQGPSARWGFRRFIAVYRLESSGFLKNDCLAVRCDITVVKIEKRAVKDEVVKGEDMARLGMLCKCNDDLCKRHHHRA